MMWHRRRPVEQALAHFEFPPVAKAPRSSMGAGVALPESPATADCPSRMCPKPPRSWSIGSPERSGIPVAQHIHDHLRRLGGDTQPPGTPPLSLAG